MKIYLVGGAVRDELLRKEANDRDYVVIGASPQKMLALGYKQVGQGFPVFLHPETGDEYALARKEVKAGPGHNGFNLEWEGVTLLEDLYRRDLTINAIAKDLETGEYIDPYGGIGDINNKILRHVSSHFTEDPLRVLRIARFLTQYPQFEIDKKTVRLCKKIAESGELNHLTGERIWKEVEKALACHNPVSFFEFLLFCGALRAFLPELANLYKVPQSAQYHPEGYCWTHTMLVLRHACTMTERIDIRYAALLHDLGKGITPNEEWPQHIKHEERGLPLIEAVNNRLRVPKSCRELALTVCEHHLRVHKCLDMKPGKVFKLLISLKAHRNSDFFHGVLECCKADSFGKETVGEYKQAVFLSTMAEVLNSLDVRSIVDRFEKQACLSENIRHFKIKHLKKMIIRFKYRNGLIPG